MYVWILPPHLQFYPIKISVINYIRPYKFWLNSRKKGLSTERFIVLLNIPAIKGRTKGVMLHLELQLGGTNSMEAWSLWRLHMVCAAH